MTWFAVQNILFFLLFQWLAGVFLSVSTLAFCFCFLHKLEISLKQCDFVKNSQQLHSSCLYSMTDDSVHTILHVFMLKQQSVFLSLRTIANRNCHYNACSIALVNDVPLISCLRCLTSIALFENFEFFSFHPLLEKQHAKGASQTIISAFGMIISDIALDAFRGQSYISAVFAEVCNEQRISHVVPWSVFLLCLLLLASQLRHTILQNPSMVMKQKSQLK